MKSEEIRQRFIEFFEKRGHAVIPSASLVPENDPSVLFNTAGMQPLVPFLMGEPHPRGKRLVNVQKCVRTQDIEEVGDNTHDTFFEMLGNWSLGDYFKEEAIKWSYELLTSKEEGFGLDPEKLYVTVFAGNDDAPKDEESAKIWRSVGVPEERIFFLEDNWWSPGDNGPCGPDSEMFYNVSGKDLDIKTLDDFKKADDAQEIVEIWNDVFMEFEKKDGVVIGKLGQKNVDTGAGLERLVMVLQGQNNIFGTDLFLPIITVARNISSSEVNARIITDHFRTASLMITDGVAPANSDRGYILRRLLRRAYVKTSSGFISEDEVNKLVQGVVAVYGDLYKVESNKRRIVEIITEEYRAFSASLESGLKAISKGEKDPFILMTTYGLPKEVLVEQGVEIDEVDLSKKIKEHQELSRKGAEQKFKGGLADHSEMSVKYHTATHLLHQALRDVLGNHVFQKGSNITSERLRFDFSHGEKMTEEEKKQVEDIVNDKISQSLPVTYEDIPQAEAEKRGAIGLFEEKYGDKVRVYQIGEGDNKYSLEFCGGPHVKNTGELGKFRIKKEEASSQGVRRIKAILE